MNEYNANKPYLVQGLAGQQAKTACLEYVVGYSISLTKNLHIYFSVFKLFHDRISIFRTHLRREFNTRIIFFKP